MERVSDNLERRSSATSVVNSRSLLPRGMSWPNEQVSRPTDDNVTYGDQSGAGGGVMGRLSDCQQIGVDISTSMPSVDCDVN